MATKLFLRSTNNSGIADGAVVYRDLLTTAGAGAVVAEVDSVNSGTEIQWTLTTAGDVEVQWITGYAASAFTLTSVAISIWGQADGPGANSMGRARLFKRAADGTETELAGGPFDDDEEFRVPNPEEFAWTANGTDTAFAVNDRLLLKLYITNIGTMGNGEIELKYNAADAAEGDSFITLAETVTFRPGIPGSFAAMMIG